MSRLACANARRTRKRAFVVAFVTAVAMIATLALCAANDAAFADTLPFRIQSTSTVGPRSGALLSPAVRLDPPQAVATLPLVEAPATAVPLAQPVNLSSCRSDLAGSVMTITVPDISYSCPVYVGGQAMLNSGAVTQISDPAIASVLASHPGGPGLLWVAAHRVSHGGAFAAVPSLADGAIITVTDATFTASYRIVGRLYVGVQNDRVIDASGHATGAATLDSIIRPDHGGGGAARLLLQTCDGDDHRWMIYADLVG